MQPAAEIIERKGALPGAFMVELTRTRRNSKDVTLDADVVNKIKSCCRGMDISPPSSRVAVRIIAGVKLNGRPIAHGDMCVCVKTVPRSRSAVAGSQAYHAPCKVIALYQIACGDQEELFVEVVVIKIHSKQRALFIIPKSEANLTGVTASTVVHFDSVIVMLHVCPHYDDDSLVVACPMWDTR
jgi:hypothetical protein